MTGICEDHKSRKRGTCSACGDCKCCDPSENCQIKDSHVKFSFYNIGKVNKRQKVGAERAHQIILDTLIFDKWDQQLIGLDGAQDQSLLPNYTEENGRSNKRL